VPQPTTLLLAPQQQFSGADATIYTPEGVLDTQNTSAMKPSPAIGDASMEWFSSVLETVARETFHCIQLP
jgi:hypothetical protein